MADENSKSYRIEKESYLWEIKIENWDGFCQLFNNEFDLFEKTSSKPLLRNYVWRGHRLNKWKLESSFDREFNKREDKEKRDYILKRHLNSFVYSCRGKLKEFNLTISELKKLIRGQLLEKEHIWALGQHYGLATPLLDWCYSPFVAAFFAFEKEKKKEEDNKHRVIFGLKVKEVANTLSLPIDGCQLKYFDPMSSEHLRLINQRGLFTITKDGKDIETILCKYKYGHKERDMPEGNNPWLIKIEIKDIPDTRRSFLHGLTAMNINHMSLFPEIQGAAKFCNLGIKLDEYARFRGQGPS